MGISSGYSDILPKFVDQIYKESGRQYIRARTKEEIEQPYIQFAFELSKTPSLSGISPMKLLPSVRQLAAYVLSMRPVINNYTRNPTDVDAGMALKQLTIDARSFFYGWMNELGSLRATAPVSYAPPPASDSVPASVPVTPKIPAANAAPGTTAVATTSEVAPDTTPTKTNPLTIAAIGFGVLKLLAII